MDHLLHLQPFKYLSGVEIIAIDLLLCLLIALDEVIVDSSYRCL